MAELTPQERLQPSLLDRLTDDEPQKTQESRQQRVLSLAKLRDGVLRDLGWLFNCDNLESVHDLADLPEVRRSVLNYGLPSLAGATASSIDAEKIEEIVKQAICDFEPRILRQTVEVRVIVTPGQMNKNALAFDIRADLWAQPAPLHLYLKTEVDLESGNVAVLETSGPPRR